MLYSGRSYFLGRSHIRLAPYFVLPTKKKHSMKWTKSSFTNSSYFVKSLKVIYNHKVINIIHQFFNCYTKSEHLKFTTPIFFFFPSNYVAFMSPKA